MGSQNKGINLNSTKKGMAQTCTSQRLKLFCFGELPDMWFCQKLLKNTKNNSQIEKIWLFL